MPEKPTVAGMDITEAVKKMDERLQTYLTDAGVLPADKSMDDGCYKQALDKHLEAGMVAADAEKKARAECTSDAPDPGEKARSVGGCVGASIDRHIANGIPINRAYMLAEEECIGARKEVMELVPDGKEYVFSADPNWLPERAEKALTERIWSRIKVALGSEDKAPEATSFKVAGNHWLAVWSNNFKDRDGEIFPQKALDAYVARVDNGLVKPPELWVWHIGKSASIGQADWVGTHGHFVLAGGTFDDTPQAQKARDFYAKSTKDTAISHGFTFPADKFDGKHYHEFNTFEISLLPRGVEANLYTSLEGVKDMALDEKKLKYIGQYWGEADQQRILKALDQKGKDNEELGTEFKDFSSVELTDDKESLNKALADLVPDLMEGSGEAVNAALEAVKAVKALRTEMAELKQHIAQTLDQRPRSASREETTVLDKDKHKELYDKVQDGSAVYDNFWGSKLKQNMGGS